jgi:dipeptidase E
LAYDADVRWDGLGILDYAIVPHYRSPDHPETERVERVVAHYRGVGIPYRTLSDGQALVVDGDRTLVV